MLRDYEMKECDKVHLIYMSPWLVFVSFWEVINILLNFSQQMYTSTEWYFYQDIPNAELEMTTYTSIVTRKAEWYILVSLMSLWKTYCWISWSARPLPPTSNGIKPQTHTLHAVRYFRTYTRKHRYQNTDNIPPFLYYEVWGKSVHTSEISISHLENGIIITRNALWELKHNILKLLFNKQVNA